MKPTIVEDDDFFFEQNIFNYDTITLTLKNKLYIFHQLSVTNLNRNPFVVVGKPKCNFHMCFLACQNVGHYGFSNKDNGHLMLLALSSIFDD